MRKKTVTSNSKQQKPGGKVMKSTCRLTDDAGNVILTIEKVEEALTSHKTIKKYAWIIHDHDTYTANDEKKNPAHKAGTLKPAHFHIVMVFDCYMPFENVANWFGIPSNFFENTKNEQHNPGENFLDCVQYLTHEHQKQQDLGKYLYPDECVHANFDFRAELDERADRSDSRNAKEKAEAKKRMRRAVLNGKPLTECKAEDEDLFIEDLSKLEKLHGTYLKDYQTLPRRRLNIYISGYAGSGKGLTSKAIACALYPKIKDPHRVYFEVGGRNCTFEGYDGQPVIIWNDFRSFELWSHLQDRNSIFNIFETTPTTSRFQIKFSSVVLANTVNIVNSVQPTEDFLNALAGEYVARDGTIYSAEDKIQIYRRFCVLIDCAGKTYHFRHNEGFFNLHDFGDLDHLEFLNYIDHGDFVGGLEELAIFCNSDVETYREVSALCVAPVVSLLNSYLDKLNAAPPSPEEVYKRFAHTYGPVVKPAPAPEKLPEQPQPKHVFPVEHVTDEDLGLPFP